MSGVSVRPRPRLPAMLVLQSSQSRNVPLTRQRHPADMSEHCVVAAGGRDVAPDKVAAVIEGTQRPPAATHRSTCWSPGPREATQSIPGHEGPSGSPSGCVVSDAEIALWFG